MRGFLRASARVVDSDAVLHAIDRLNAAGLIVPSPQWTLRPDILPGKVAPEVLHATSEAVPRILTGLFTARVNGTTCSKTVFMVQVIDLLKLMVGIQADKAARIMSSPLAALLDRDSTAIYLALALYVKQIGLADDHLYEDGQMLHWLKSPAQRNEIAH